AHLALLTSRSALDLHARTCSASHLASGTCHGSRRTALHRKAGARRPYNAGVLDASSETMRPTRRRHRQSAGPAGPPREPPPGHDDLVDRIEAYPRRRTYLLPALHDVQHAFGWLPDWAIELVGAHLRVPKSEAYGIG